MACCRLVVLLWLLLIALAFARSERRWASARASRDRWVWTRRTRWSYNERWVRRGSMMSRRGGGRAARWRRRRQRHYVRRRRFSAPRFPPTLPSGYPMPRWVPARCEPCRERVRDALRYHGLWKRNAKRYGIGPKVIGCVKRTSVKMVCDQCLKNRRPLGNVIAGVLPHCMALQIPYDIALHPDKDIEDNIHTYA